MAKPDRTEQGRMELPLDSRPTPSVLAWIRRLRLEPHPEGGWFRETYRASESVPSTALPPRYAGARAMATAIYYLLPADGFSAFHCVASDETWHHYAGGTVRLHIIDEDGTLTERGVGLGEGVDVEPQQTVPAGSWFAAEVEADAEFALVGCTVAPGFDFADFELAESETLARKYPAHRALIERLTRVD